MAQPFYYGDSYGQVQGAAQAAENSDRALMASLIAAQQRGQELALQQQLAPFQVMDANRRFGLQQAQFMEGVRQFNEQTSQRKRESEEAADLGWAGIDLRADALSQREKELEKKYQGLMEEKMRIGQPLASTFGKSLLSQSEALKAFQDAQNQFVQLTLEGERSRVQGILDFNTKEKRWVPAPDKASDKSVIQRAADLNDKMRQAALAIKQAEDTAKRSEVQLRDAARLAQSQGFIPDMTAGTLLHPKTGQAFNFLQAQQDQVQNQPRISGRYNPKTGKIER